MAACFCDRAIALHSGGLIANGTPQEIMTTDELASICDVEMDILLQPSSNQRVALAK
jgi:iron-chelate-transporting ATPase